MTNPIDAVVQKLKDCNCNPKQTRTGWKAKCPAHLDKNPSLGLSVGDDQRVLIKCRSGCSYKAICEALGLRTSDLFASNSKPAVTKTKRKPAENLGYGDGDTTVYPNVQDAIAVYERKLGTVSMRWCYRDASGVPIGYVIRWDTPTGKQIRPVSRTKDGSGWTLAGMTTPRLLYRLPELLAASASALVYVVEGEKAADAAASLGVVATTSPHGSKSAGKADWSPLSGRSVVILPDNDDAGEQYADDVAKLASAAGAKSVRVVRLAELWVEMPKGGDIVDFLEHRDGEQESVRKEIEALVTNATQLEIPEQADLAVFKPFPVDVLPEPIRSFIVDGAKSMGCDASFVALPLLAVCATAIGNRRRIQLKQGWTEPSILWLLTVGESGAMKTPPFKLALEAIRKAQGKMFLKYESDLKLWESETLDYEAEMTIWKRLRTGQGGHNAAGSAPTKPKPPIQIRYLVNDVTTEALAPILCGNPRGVLLARDELNGWIGSFDRYAKSGRSGADASHWLSMHNGESMTIDRKTGIPPTIHVPSASVSITGGIQPGILARAMGIEHHESGLLARLLFAMPPRRQKHWTELQLADEVKSKVATLIDSLLGLTPGYNDEGQETAEIMHLSSGGKQEWIRFYNEHNAQQMTKSGDAAAAWSKLEGYVARFALIIHNIRLIQDDATHQCSDQIDEISVAAAVTLVNWFGHEQKRVYAVLSESEEGRSQRELLDWIGAQGGIVTVRDLTHGMRKYRGDSGSAETALIELVTAGFLMRETTQSHTGGRPTEQFRLVTSVTVTETPKLLEQSDSIGDTDGEIPDSSTDNDYGEI